MLLLSHFLLLSFQCSPSWRRDRKRRVRQSRAVDLQNRRKHFRCSDTLYTQGLAEVKQWSAISRVSLTCLRCYWLSVKSSRHNKTNVPFLLLTFQSLVSPCTISKHQTKMAARATSIWQGQMLAAILMIVIHHTPRLEWLLTWQLNWRWSAVLIFTCLRLFWNVLTLWYNLLFSHSNNFWMDLRVWNTQTKISLYK